MVKGGGRKEDWCGMKKEQEKWTEQKGGAPYVETQKEGRKAADPLVSGVGQGKVPEAESRGETKAGWAWTTCPFCMWWRRKLKLPESQNKVQERPLGSLRLWGMRPEEQGHV